MALACFGSVNWFGFCPMVSALAMALWLFGSLFQLERYCLVSGIDWHGATLSVSPKLRLCIIDKSI